MIQHLSIFPLFPLMKAKTQIIQERVYLMAAKRVYMSPNPSQARLDDSNSINQIVLKMQEHLVEFGWEITEDKSQADLIASHAGMTIDGNFDCDVAHSHGLYPTFHHHEPR